MNTAANPSTSALASEGSVAVVCAEVGYDHGPIGDEGADTWTFAEFALQLFELQR